MKDCPLAFSYYRGTAVECMNAVTVGSFLGGLVTGVVFSLLVVGVVFGVAKLRQQGKGSKSKE